MFLQVGTIIDKRNVGQSAFSLCFDADGHKPEEEDNLKKDYLWIGCRDGSIFKLNGSKTVEYDISKTSTVHLDKPFGLCESDTSENYAEMHIDKNDDTRRHVEMTCHRRMEWGENNIIIVGYSDGTLRIFDATNKVGDLAKATCTFSVQICKNRISRIDDVKVAEFKNKNDEQDLPFALQDWSLQVEEDGSFDWWLFDENESKGCPDKLPNKESKYNEKKRVSDTQDTNIFSNKNVQKCIEMAILISTETTLEENVTFDDDGSNLEEDTAFVRPTSQSFALFLHGRIEEGDKQINEKRNDAVIMQMKMKKNIASGHAMCLSMRSIIVWSRLKKVVRYIDIPPMLIGPTKEEINKQRPMSRALFFMATTNKHQTQRVISKWITENEMKNKTKMGTFEYHHFHGLQVASVLDDGSIYIYPTSSTNDIRYDWITIVLNSEGAIYKNSFQDFPDFPDFHDIRCSNCDFQRNVVAVSTFALNPRNFLTLCNPDCCLSLRVWAQESKTYFSRCFLMIDFIKDPYWPYETDIEKQMPIMVCMTTVYLSKKCYAVIVFSPTKDAKDNIRKKSCIFVTEIPIPYDVTHLQNEYEPAVTCDDGITSKITKVKIIPQIKSKEARKLYLNGNMEIFDTIIDVQSCPPYFEEYFACIHARQGVSIWTVKGSQLKWICPPTHPSISKSIPYFMSSYTSNHHENDSDCHCYMCYQGGVGFNQLSNNHSWLSSATFSMSYAKEIEEGLTSSIDILDVFSGKDIKSELNAHSGLIGNIFFIPVQNDTFHTTSTLSLQTTIRSTNKRKWNREGEHTTDKKRKIGLGSTAKIGNAVTQNYFNSSVKNARHEERDASCKDAENDGYRIPNLLSTTSFYDNKVILWANDSENTRQKAYFEEQSASNTSKLQGPCVDSIPQRVGVCPQHQNSIHADNINSKIVAVIAIKCKIKWKSLKISTPTYTNSVQNLEFERKGKINNVSNSRIISSSKTHYIKDRYCIGSSFEDKQLNSAPLHHRDNKPSSEDTGFESKRKVFQENTISDVVCILSEDGRMVVSKFLDESSTTQHQQPPTTKATTTKNNEHFKCDHNHWEFTKHQRNKEQKQKQEEEDVGDRKSKPSIASKAQYCLECCCSYTAINNEIEKMSLLKLLGSNKNVEMRKEQNYKINMSSSGLTCLEERVQGENEDIPQHTSQDEDQEPHINQSLNLNQLLEENIKKKKMLQTLGENGLGKMTSISAIHVSYSNGLTFCPFEMSEKDDEANKEEFEENEPCENNIAAKRHKNGFETQPNVISLEKDDNKSKTVPLRANDAENVTKIHKRNRRRPGKNKVSFIRNDDDKKENRKGGSITIPKCNIEFACNKDKTASGYETISTKGTFNCNDVCVDRFALNETSSSSQGSLLHQYLLHDEENTKSKNEHKWRNDEVDREQEAINSLDEQDDIGHDSKYSFVIFITTSFPRKYPSVPSFVIWSYDIMIDEKDTEKRGRNNGYDNSPIFEKECNTQKLKEDSLSPFSPISPIGVIPYGNRNETHRSLKCVDEGHEQNRQPLALCSDIKIIEKRGDYHQKATKKSFSLKEITVMALLGLENGDILEYSFDMSLMPGLTNPRWMITSDPRICRKLSSINLDRMVSLHYKTSNVILQKHFFEQPQCSFLNKNFSSPNVKTNENFVCTTLAEVVVLQDYFETTDNFVTIMEGMHPKMFELISSEDGFSPSQTIRSFSLKHHSRTHPVKLIIFGSKEGCVYIYKAFFDSPKCRLEKVGKYDCGNSSSEIISCIFIEKSTKNNDSSGDAQISHNTLPKGSNKYGMEVLGHIIAANKCGNLFLLKVCMSS